MSVSPSAVSRVTGVGVQYKNFNAGAAAMLPQRLIVIGVGNKDVVYTEDKYECEGSASEVGERFGFGSPLHLAAKQLYPMSGSGASFPVTIYPLANASGASQAQGTIAATGSATSSGSARVFIGGIIVSVAIASGDTAAVVLGKIKDAIEGELDMPVSAGNGEDGTITLTAKAAGTVGNLIKVFVESTVAGIVFTCEQLTGGATDPDVETALNKVKAIWETAVLFCGDYKAAGVLDKFMVWGKDRWSDLVKMPVIVFHGCTDDYGTRTGVTEGRADDFINALVTSVGSPELPYVIAAKAMVNDILTTADANPAQGYKGLLEGLVAGADSDQELYAVRNQSVMKGASTNIKTGSVAELNDIITMYHPAAEGKYPSRRYVVDIMKLMNIVYNCRLLMEADDLKGAPLIGDADVTSNPKAIQPKTVKTWFLNLARSLCDKAICQDFEFTKNNLDVKIDSENPKRLNVKFPVKLSGNVEVSSTDLYFGFYIGG
ncbi:MAG: hypothetical protein MJZ37_07490 [Bacilli bacterium]|nr:hypothetical protein [Bacilli bacterium]